MIKSTQSSKGSNRGSQTFTAFPFMKTILYKTLSFLTLILKLVGVFSQSKALRERWLLDGAPAEEETQKRLQDDEVKTKLLEQVILK